MAAVHHYFINSQSIGETSHAATFEHYALHAVDTIFTTADVAIVAGGTGLYIKAFCEGLDAIPTVPENIRQNIRARYETEGLSFLQNELKKTDPLFWTTADQQNPQRLMRALEVQMATGNSILSYQQNARAERPFRIVKIGLELPRETLYQQINFRVDEMMREGLLEEVKFASRLSIF